jgi:cell division protein ZipA
LAAELRWILLGLCLPLLVGIWWWTAHRTRQAPGNAELRESAPPLDPHYAASGEDPAEEDPEPRDWGVPPFEPLSIRAADLGRVPVLDAPMMVPIDPPQTGHAPMAAAAPPAPISPIQPVPRTLSRPPTLTTAAPLRPVLAGGTLGDNSDRFAAVAPAAPNSAETQRIVTIRVCAAGEMRWSGGQLAAALELHGLAFGRYQVFHRKHADGRSLFCVASLIEPGTFDVARMAEQEFRGVTMFAVLPGPIPPVDTVDELLGTARGLAEALSGMLQDAKGLPMSPQRAAALRADVARFQAALPGS